MFKYELDPDDKLVRLIATGFMSLDEVEDMNRQLFICAENAHRQFGVYRMLTDARDAPVQAADVAARYILPTAVMTGPDDRLAVVVSSSLAKMQVNRMLNDKRAQAFLSINAARTWLLAYAIE